MYKSSQMYRLFFFFCLLCCR